MPEDTHVANSLSTAISRVMNIFGRSTRRLVKVIHALEVRLQGASTLDSQAVARSTTHDMRREPNEQYYLHQYLNHIRPHLPANAGATVLDLGCGQGRLIEALLSERETFRIVGVDCSERALEGAQDLCKSGRVELHAADIVEFLRTQASASFDAVIMTEVTFFYKNWEESLPLIRKVLKPNGRAFISFRSRVFYALLSVYNRDFENLKLLATQRSGRLAFFGLPETTFTWQTSNEIRRLLNGSSGLRLLDLLAIGSLSGISGDPLATIAIPSELSEAQKEALFGLEQEVARDAPDLGRYMLAIIEPC